MVLTEQQLLEKFNPLIIEHTFVKGNTVDSYVKKHEIDFTSRGIFDFLFFFSSKTPLYYGDFRFRLYSPTLIDQTTLNYRNLKITEAKKYTLEVNKLRGISTYKVQVNRQSMVGKIFNEVIEGNNIRYTFQPENTTDIYEFIKEKSIYQLPLKDKYIVLFPPRPQNNMNYWGINPLRNYPNY